MWYAVEGSNVHDGRNVAASGITPAYVAAWGEELGLSPARDGHDWIVVRAETRQGALSQAERWRAGAHSPEDAGFAAMVRGDVE